MDDDNPHPDRYYSSPYATQQTTSTYKFYPQTPTKSGPCFTPKNNKKRIIKRRKREHIVKSLVASLQQRHNNNNSSLFLSDLLYFCNEIWINIEIIFRACIERQIVKVLDIVQLIHTHIRTYITNSTHDDDDDKRRSHMNNNHNSSIVANDVSLWSQIRQILFPQQQQDTTDNYNNNLWIKAPEIDPYESWWNGKVTLFDFSRYLLKDYLYEKYTGIQSSLNGHTTATTIRSNDHHLLLEVEKEGEVEKRDENVYDDYGSDSSRPNIRYIKRPKSLFHFEILESRPSFIDGIEYELHHGDGGDGFTAVISTDSPYLLLSVILVACHYVYIVFLRKQPKVVVMERRVVHKSSSIASSSRRKRRDYHHHYDHDHNNNNNDNVVPQEIIYNPNHHYHEEESVVFDEENIDEGEEEEDDEDDEFLIDDGVDEVNVMHPLHHHHHHPVSFHPPKLQRESVNTGASSSSSSVNDADAREFEDNFYDNPILPDLQLQEVDSDEGGVVSLGFISEPPQNDDDVNDDGGNYHPLLLLDERLSPLNLLSPDTSRYKNESCATTAAADQLFICFVSEVTEDGGEDNNCFSNKTNLNKLQSMRKVEKEHAEWLAARKEDGTVVAEGAYGGLYDDDDDDLDTSNHEESLTTTTTTTTPAHHRCSTKDGMMILKAKSYKHAHEIAMSDPYHQQCVCIFRINKWSGKLMNDDKDHSTAATTTI